MTGAITDTASDTVTHAVTDARAGDDGAGDNGAGDNGAGIEEARPNRQRERSERSTNALLEAAAELIGEGGFAALTFAAIGERAGYSRGMVTARFGNKDGLIDALIDRIVTGWSHRNVIPRTTGRRGLDAALIIIDAIEKQAARDPSALRVLYVLMFEAVGADAAMRARFAEFHQDFRSDIARMIARGVADGSVRADADPESEGALVVAAIRGIGYQWLLAPDTVDPVPMLAHLRSATEGRLAA